MLLQQVRFAAATCMRFLSTVPLFVHDEFRRVLISVIAAWPIALVLLLLFHLLMNSVDMSGQMSFLNERPAATSPFACIWSNVRMHAADVVIQIGLSLRNMVAAFIFAWKGVHI